MGEIIQLVQRYREAATLEERLAQGDALLNRIAPDLQLFLHGSCPPDTAADLLQDIFVQIIRGLLRFEGSADAAFWAWCYRIARNRLADHFRGKAARMEPMEPEALRQLLDETETTRPLSVEDRDDLAFALRLLSQAKPDCLDLLWSHYVVGLDYGELAEQRSLSYDAARVKLSRCLQAAQTLIAR